MDFPTQPFRSEKPSRNQSKKSASHRSLRMESLETREMLAVSILSAPITAYAATDHEAEIRIVLGNDTGGSSQIDFTVTRSGDGSTLDPAQIRVYDHATKKTVALSNVKNGKTSSSASATLKAGTYSVFVSADAGQGNFSLDIHRDDTPVQVNPGLAILVEAAMVQQDPSAWLTWKSYYNDLLTPYYGPNALNGKSILSQYPEVDVNGDGRLDSTDYALAEQLVVGYSATPEVVSYVVVTQDSKGPTITAKLQNDTGASGDRITVDTTIVGAVTDSSGVKSAYYTLDGGGKVALTLDANGNYTIPNHSVSAGSHTVVIVATDKLGNESTSTFKFQYAAATPPTVPASTNVAEGGSASVSLGSAYAIQQADGRNIAAGQTLTLADEAGTVKLNANGTLTFTPGTAFRDLGDGDSKTFDLVVVSQDEHGRSFTSTVRFRVEGQNDPPFLVDTEIPGTEFEEGNSGAIPTDTILAKWNDYDKDSVLSVVDAVIAEVDCSNEALTKFTAENLQQYLSLNVGNVTLDASDPFFADLGPDERLTITVSYRVFDGVDKSSRSGSLTFTVVGVDNPASLSENDGPFTVPPNNLNAPRQTIAPDFSFSDPDWVDRNGTLVYSIQSVSVDGDVIDNDELGLVEIASDGRALYLNTEKLDDRYAEGVVSVTVLVVNASGGTAETTLTVDLQPIDEPTGSASFFITETQSVSQNIAEYLDVVGSGFELSGLTGDRPEGVMATLNADGNFVFDPGTVFEYLRETDEPAVVELQYTITDTLYGLIGTGTITLTISGVTTPATPPEAEDAIVGLQGEYYSAEDEGTASPIPIAKDDLLADWTIPEGGDAYSIVLDEGAEATFYRWSGNETHGTETNPFGDAVLGTVSLGHDGELVFTPTPGLFQELGAGEWVDVLVVYSVQNGTTDAVPGGGVLFRVCGSDDAGEITATPQVFDDVIANDRKNPAKEIDLDLNYADPDWIDQNGELVYSIRSVDVGGEAIDNGATGLVGIEADGSRLVLNTDKLEDAEQAGVVTVVVLATNASGGTAEIELTINLEVVPAPTAPALEKELLETETFGEKIIPVVEGNDFEFVDLTGDFPDGVVATLDADGTFFFDPGTAFEYLKETDEPVVLELSYTIIDNRYDLPGTGTITLTIFSVATPATAPDDGLVGADGIWSEQEVDGSVPNVVAPKEDVLADWTLPEGSDNYSIVSDGEVRFESWSGSPADTNPFDGAVLGTVFVDENGDLVFEPTPGLFQSLGEGEWMDVAVDFGVENNDSDAPAVSGGTALFRIEGRNDTPVLEFVDDEQNEAVWEISETSEGEIIDLTDYLTDPDVRDTHSIVSINGTEWALGETMTLDSGAVLTWLDGLRIRYQPAGAFDSLAEGAEAFDALTVVVTDGHIDGSTSATLKVKITGVNTDPTFIGDDESAAITVDASTSNVVDWNGTLFEDIDEGDKLSIWKINDQVVAEQAFEDVAEQRIYEIVVAGGAFYYNAATKELRFVPSADYDSLSAGVTEAIPDSATLTVTDLHGLTAAGEIALTVAGTNKTPVVLEGQTTLSTEVQTPVDITAESLVDDVNTADDHFFVSVTIEDEDGREYTLNADRLSVTLASGTTLTLSDDLSTLTVDGSPRYEFLDKEHSPETLNLAIVVRDDSGADNASVSGMLTVEIDGVEATSPTVGPIDLADVWETGIESPVGEDLNAFIEDTNIPNRTGSTDWYAISDFQIDAATIDDLEIDGKLKSAIETVFRSFLSDGVLTLGDFDGCFDFLAAGETLLLTFKYKVTDTQLVDDGGNELSAWGTITLAVEGVNNDPVLSGDDTVVVRNTRDTVLLDDIPLGQFEFDDVDRREDESYTWSVENCAGTLGAEPLAVWPDIDIDDDGNVSLDRASLESLAWPPGTSAILSFDVVLRDGNGGEDRKTVTLTIQMKNRPQVAVDDIEVLESDDMSAGQPIAVTDPAEDFMEPRTDAWFQTPTIVSVDVDSPDEPGKHASKFVETLPEDFFEIVEDVESPSGYSIVFKENTDWFAFLQKDETLVFTVTLLVKDAEYDVETTTELTCTITGVGNVHTANVSETPHEIWSNVRDENETTVDAETIGYDIDDPDEGEEHSFRLTGIRPDSGVWPDGLSEEELLEYIDVDPDSGAVTIRHEGFAGLVSGERFVLQIAVTGNVDGHSVEVELELQVHVAGAPQVTPSKKDGLEENESFEEPIVVTPPEDGADRDGDWYEIGDVYLIDGELPEGVLVSDIARVDDQGRFVFQPDGAFAYLGVGEEATLRFGVDVRDTKFATESSWTIDVTVIGENAAPQGNVVVVDQDAVTGDPIVVGDQVVCLGTLEELGLVSDDDASDRHALLAIGGLDGVLVDIVHGDWVTVPGLGQFKYQGGELGAGGLYYGGTLLYKALSDAENDYLETIGHGDVVSLEFRFVVQDDSGVLESRTSEGGQLTIKVVGTNSEPVFRKTDGFRMEEGQYRDYVASDFVDDKNDGDEHRFHSINGVEITAKGQQIVLDDGTTITVLDDDCTTIRIDVSTRFAHRNLSPGIDETQILEIVIDDGSQAENSRTFPTPVPLVVRGINDPPGMDAQSFGVSMDGQSEFVTQVGSVYLTDLDTALSDYRYEIVAGSTAILEKSDAEISGEMPQFAIEAKTGKIYFLTASAPELTGGQSIAYTFQIRAYTAAGEEVTATITVTLGSKKAPQVDLVLEDGKLTLKENDGEQTVEPKVTDLNDDRTGSDWYSFENVRYLEGTRSGTWGSEPVTTLPEGVSFGFREGSDVFYFDPGKAFDFLGAGETATLQFEFAVRDTLYGVDRIVLITVIVEGVNSDPEALNYTASPAVPADSSEGLRFYLSDLATDHDARDELFFDTVNGQELTLGGQAVRLYDESGLFMGTVKWLYDETLGDYLLYLPNAKGSCCEAIGHRELKSGSFTFTVRDGSGAVSEAATVDFQVLGVNKTPLFIPDEMSRTIEEQTTTLIDPNAITTDANTGDGRKIIGVRIGGEGGMEYRLDLDLPGDIEIRLVSGAILTLRADGTLVYDSQTPEFANLASGAWIDELFEIMVDDGSKAADSRTGWELFTLTVEGVNDLPQDLLPGENEIVGKLGGEIRIDLSEHFSDPDLDFNLLQFSIAESIDDFVFIDSINIENGVLILRFLPKGMYDRRLDFSPQTLTLIVFDGHDSVEKTFTVKLAEEHTVQLEIRVSETEVEAGERYDVEVWASELLNELLGSQTASLGLESVSFTIYFDKDLCTVDPAEIESVGDHELRYDGSCITFTLSGMTANELIDCFELMLLKFTVTAKGVAGQTKSVVFSLGDVVVARNEAFGIVDGSQIELAGAEVAHVGPDVEPTVLLVGFSAPSAPAAFSILAMPNTWTADDELISGDGDDENDTLLLDLAFGDEDDDFPGSGTGYSAGLDPTGDNGLANDRFQDAWEDILAEFLLEREGAPRTVLADGTS